MKKKVDYAKVNHIVWAWMIGLFLLPFLFIAGANLVGVLLETLFRN